MITQIMNRTALAACVCMSRGYLLKNEKYIMREGGAWYQCSKVEYVSIYFT